MITTIGQNDKGYIVQKYDPVRETIFMIDGLSFDEVLEETKK